MSPRRKITLLLVVSATILAFIPMSGKYTLHGSPERILARAVSSETFLSPDQVAKAVVSNDSTIQLIDLRSREDFAKFSIPGAINIPYREFFKRDWEGILNSGLKNVFYSNDDFQANYAFILSQGLGYVNCAVMKGGLNEWMNIVMNSHFTGEKITARENSLFETRYKARNMVREFNSMPDSLKLKYYAAKEIERKKLDGGCE